MDGLDLLSHGVSLAQLVGAEAGEGSPFGWPRQKLSECGLCDNGVGVAQSAQHAADELVVKREELPANHGCGGSCPRVAGSATKGGYIVAIPSGGSCR